jgi:hypothetical protein
MKSRLSVQDRSGTQQKRTQWSDMAEAHAHVYLQISYGTNEPGIAYSRASAGVTTLRIDLLAASIAKIGRRVGNDGFAKVAHLLT